MQQDFQALLLHVWMCFDDTSLLFLSSVLINRRWSENQHMKPRVQAHLVSICWSIALCPDLGWSKKVFNTVAVCALLLTRGSTGWSSWGMGAGLHQGFSSLISTCDFLTENILSQCLIKRKRINQPNKNSQSKPKWWDNLIKRQTFFHLQKLEMFQPLCYRCGQVNVYPAIPPSPYIFIH